MGGQDRPEHFRFSISDFRFRFSIFDWRSHAEACATGMCFCLGCVLLRLLYEPLVVLVLSNEEPVTVVAKSDAQCAVVEANPSRPN